MKRNLLFVLILFSFFSEYIPAQSPIVQDILNQANSDSLVYFVKELSGNVPTIINGTNYTIQSRNKYQPGNDMAADYIQQKLEYYGLTVTNQTFSSSGRNVLAVQLGTESPEQKYIICAHYDDMPSGTLAPGADDNASGTSAVLEAARIFSQYSFPFTIIYALWDEEEQGLVGSEYYAEQAALNGEDILGVINMDMIAWDSDNDGIVNLHTRSVGTSLELADKMIEVNNQYNIDLVIDIYNPGSTYSDHASFWSNGFGAILLIEDDNDFNNYYHTTNDLISYFNIPYFYKSAKLSYATLASLALNLNMQIIHTPFTSIDYTTDINLTATIQTGLTIGTGNSGPKLFYRVSQGTEFSDFYQIDGVPQTSSVDYSFTIPEQPLGTIVQYYLAAQDDNSSIIVTLPSGGSGFNPPGSVPPDNFFQFFVAPTTIVFADNASNTDNWESTGTWGITTTKFVSSPSSFTDSPSGSYTNSQSTYMKTQYPIDLSNILGAELSFSAQWNIENDYDYAQVQVSTNNGINWIPMEGVYTNPGVGYFQPNGEPLYDGSQLSWINEKMDLSQFSDQQILLRFYFASDGYITADGIYIDDIVITKYVTVPVELISFTAKVTNNSILLNWNTASELNNKGFEVERSVDKKIWKTLGFIDGNGTSTNSNYYSFSDSKPLTGISYYRLKQIDFDGSFKYYKEVKADNSKLLSFNLSQNYPNPFNPATSIEFVLPEKQFVTLKVFDILGNQVAVLLNELKDKGVHTIIFDAHNLSSGMYIYKIQTEKYSATKKMILTK